MKGTRRIFLLKVITKKKVKEIEIATSYTAVYFLPRQIRGARQLRQHHIEFAMFLPNKKSLQDGEIVREAFIKDADLLFMDFKNKNEIMSAIKDFQLSRPALWLERDG